MKRALSLILILFCALTCPAQKSGNKNKTSDDKAAIAARQIILKKQILVDELDSQAKNVSLAAVRIFARTKLAEWLWKEGKDETGRAESLAVSAVEELYEKKNETQYLFDLHDDLFALLDLNAKEAAKRLKAKYNVEAAEDLSNANSLLFREGGDKIVAAKIKKALTSEIDLSSINYMLDQLRERKSPELLPILFEIINLEESGRNNFVGGSLSWVADYYRGAIVPSDLKIRFYRTVLVKARNAVQALDASSITFADDLLYAVLPDIDQNAPELSAEALALKSVLSAKTSQRTRDAQERAKRLAESADKLETLIAEAEKAESKVEKFQFYNEAGGEAVKREKFQLAVDLYDKALEILVIIGALNPELRSSQHDYQLIEIVKAALAKADVDSARYATKKILTKLSRAEALRQTAIYFFENKDSASAVNNYDGALKLVTETEKAESKFYLLFRLIRAAQTIDAKLLPEITTVTAKTIDSLSPLNPEDKPGTENFNKYVAIIMTVNVNVNSVMRDLLKKNKSEANDFAIRINRKEVKIIADLALAIDAVESEKKAANLK